MLISIKVSGSDKFLAKLNRLSDKVKDFTPEFRTLGEYLQGYYSGVAFMQQGKAFGMPWPKIKTFSKGRLSPLVVTGTMKDSFAFEPNNNSLRVYNKAPYFKYHQSAEERHRLPRRVMIGYNESIKSKIKEAITQGIVRIIQ